MVICSLFYFLIIGFELSRVQKGKFEKWREWGEDSKSPKLSARSAAVNSSRRNNASALFFVEKGGRGVRSRHCWLSRCLFRVALPLPVILHGALDYFLFKAGAVRSSSVSFPGRNFLSFQTSLLSNSVFLFLSLTFSVFLRFFSLSTFLQFHLLFLCLLHSFALSSFYFSLFFRSTFLSSFILPLSVFPTIFILCSPASSSIFISFLPILFSSPLSVFPPSSVHSISSLSYSLTCQSSRYLTSCTQTLLWASFETVRRILFPTTLSFSFPNFSFSFL